MGQCCPPRSSGAAGGSDEARRRRVTFDASGTEDSSLELPLSTPADLEAARNANLNAGLPGNRPAFLPPPLTKTVIASGEERFYSFADDGQVRQELDEIIAGASFTRKSIKRKSIAFAADLRTKIPSSNKNTIAQYKWLEDLLITIVQGAAKDTACVQDTQERVTPVFVVAGACPNGMVSSMQAVMYSHTGGSSNSIIFWWIKPQASDPNQMDKNHMNMHTQGPFKNAAGSAKAVYQPLAQKFSGDADGDFTFGVDENGRAFIEEEEAGQRRKLLIYLIWQESWSSLMARKKFITGKLCYKRGDSFYARQYKIQDAQLSILDATHEEKLTSVLPPNSIQELFAEDE